MDTKNRREAKTLVIALVIILALVAAAGFFMVPMLANFNQLHLAPGLGLKDAAIIAFIATVVVLVIFAFAAGDGLIGELQFMLAGFFSFFIILWLLIAWVF